MNPETTSTQSPICFAVTVSDWGPALNCQPAPLRCPLVKLLPPALLRQTDMDDTTLSWLVEPLWKYRCGTSHHKYGHPSVTWTGLGAQQTSIGWSEALEPVLTMTLMF